MGGGVGLPLEEQARRQPLIDAAECHVVNEGHQVRDPLGEGVEHEDPEGWGLQDDLEKYASWDREDRQLRLGCSQRRIGDLAEQRHDRDDAALSGADTVQKDLVALRADLRGPDGTLNEQRIVGAGTAVTKQPLACLCMDRRSRRFDLLQKRSLQLLEHRVRAKESCALCRIHLAPLSR